MNGDTVNVGGKQLHHLHLIFVTIHSFAILYFSTKILFFYIFTWCPSD